MNTLEWLESITGDEIREKAISNFRNPICFGKGEFESTILPEHKTFEAALDFAFNWTLSPEGYDFWSIDAIESCENQDDSWLNDSSELDEEE